MMKRYGLIALLVLLGLAWGITMPLAKIAVSQGYRHFGLIFWQFVIAAVLLGAISIFRGRGLPMGGKQLRLYAIVALIGTILPNSASYEAARHLPSGVISILMSTMPILAFPMALAMGIDRFSLLRLGGLAFGLVGVWLLIGPEASLPDRAMVAFIPLAIIAPAFYALEGNVVAKWGTYGCDAIQVLLGASLIGAIATAPLALMTGQWIDPTVPWGAPNWALLFSAIIHALAYSSYVWLVGRAGSVFAAQVSYLVTLFGIGWSMVLLSESYSSWIWLSLLLIFAGLFLVQPRTRESPLEGGSTVSNNAD